MSINSGVIIAMAVGVTGSSVVHLSKALMRMGISGIARHRKASRIIYGLGILLNFTNPLWVIVANRFAPVVYYTSMYGLGLVALVLFSARFMGEKLERKQAYGIVVVCVATLVIGAGNIASPIGSLYSANRTIVLVTATVWLVVGPLCAIAIRRARIVVQELAFGLIAGGFGAFDSILKGIAQAGPDGSAFLPSDAARWMIFTASFLGAAGAFGMVQWSYLRGCRASTLGASFNVTYVALPLVISTFAVKGQGMGIPSLIGLALLALGVYLIRTRATTTIAGYNETDAPQGGKP